jgi:hypothetical protein
MSARAQARAADREPPPERLPWETDRDAWMRSLVKRTPDGAIIYPLRYVPCPDCGMEWWQDRDTDEWLHDCIEAHRAMEGFACACHGGGGYPETCCIYRWARERAFLEQKVANLLRAHLDRRS